jgi:macrolide phosphotransferase
VPRSPLVLAALATVAVPGLDAYDARPSLQSTDDVDAAVIRGADGQHWVVRAPRTAAAGAALEAETALLGALAPHVDSGRLPFKVPRPAGFAHLPEGGRAVVHPHLPGRPLPLDRLGPGPGLAAEVGRAIAALHELPTSTVEDSGLPVYDGESYRERRLSEVDEAARTGRVPAGLLRRWEHALEDVSLWRFQPTVVHGDLSVDHMLCAGSRLTAVLGWSEAKVADPADDLAWLLVAAPQEAVDPILEAYNLARTELRDRHLADRALLAGELALARWLLHGVRTDDPEIVADATAMLVELDENTAVDDAPPVMAPTWTSAPPPEYTEVEVLAAEPPDADVDTEVVEVELVGGPEDAAATPAGAEPGTEQTAPEHPADDETRQDETGSDEGGQVEPGSGPAEAGTDEPTR